ncbi:MAG: LPS export ABC transporter permease LptG [Candidatus Omnitrophica bacterium]|jgi:lipopolysaccharide export system permease protein|nr:LPS export ABC transporter permease LptG [Candidatus Omnitrophota bacterium]MDD3274640.1 LPS export ABC transporter permease LptG [Candidatus Omnitrophota bacterium]MDD5078113.1 LPS export ABC transporter permease LptG [Candidatus Omnitrophota bacterium]MDD5725052.1 LPS export ABC transporter permease LptG [Candidatus Omnitrophota bacterium]
MRILDRYILKSVVTIFISCIFVFLFLYVVIDLLSNLDEVLKHRASLILMVRYYLSYLPIMFVQVSPFACLLSTVYTFGKLNHDNEIIAMRSSGMSIYSIARNPLIFGMLISMAVFLVGDRLVPSSMAENQKIKIQIEEGSRKGKSKKKEVITNLTLYGLRNRLFFISKFSPSTKTMEGITILEQDENQNLTKKIIATKGVYQDGLWKFYQSITYKFDENGQVVDEPGYMEEEIMSIPETPDNLASLRQKPEEMSIRQIQDYIWVLSKSGATSVIRGLKVDLYQRFVSPFTSIIIILLGIPFSLMMRKRATGMSSIGVSIIVGFLYYILDAICLALGKSGLLMPVLAASLSHIVMLSGSIYLISKLP